MKNVFKNTWQVLTETERKRFLRLTALDVFISVVDVFSLFLLLWIVQFYVQPDKKLPAFLPSWFTNKDSLFIALFFGLFSLKNAAGFLIARAHHFFSSDVAVRISENNLVRYQQGSFNQFVEVDSSKHVRKIAFQPFEFCQHVLSGIQQIITQLCLVSITVTAVVLFNAKLFLLLLCVLLPPASLVFYFLKKKLAEAKQQIQESNERSYRYLFDALKGYVEGNVFSRNDFFLQRFLKARRKFSTHLFDVLSLQSLPSRLIEIFAVMGLFVLILIAKWTADKAGLLTVGAFMAAAYKIIPGLVKIINLAGQIKAYEFSLNDFETKKRSNAGTRLTEAKIHSVELNNIGFSYEGLNVVNNFSLCMKPGDFIGISGRSGKGKTTLLNMLLGFLPHHRGQIAINERLLNWEEIKNYWPLIAYVRQQNFLIHDTVLRNITLEEEENDSEQLACALQVAGLKEFVQQSAEGLQKLVTENGKNISGGQQQRIALARALYKNADLILLDEPFNELDEASEILLLKQFQHMAASGKIVVMITHNKTAFSFCNKTVCLDEN